LKTLAKNSKIEYQKHAYKGASSTNIGLGQPKTSNKKSSILKSTSSKKISLKSKNLSSYNYKANPLKVSKPKLRLKS
jgi:hypothetical protein